MFERERLPEGLAEIPPGPELAQMLATSNRDMLSGFDRVELMKARYRQVAHDQAELYADMVSIADAENEALSPDLGMDDIRDVAASEIRAALALTRRAAEYQLSLAAMLVEDYPHVWQALSEGRVDVPKARVICNQTMHLDPETRGRVADVALGQASTQTTGQLRARIERLVISVDPDSASRRYEQGVEERRVGSEANPDGSANLYGMQLPAAEAQAAMRRINRLARDARSKDDPRTMDQVRADVFLDLLRGRRQAMRRSGRDRGVVDIHVDLTTLMGLSENPGDIPGWGPVISDIARKVVGEQAESEHRVTVTDPETGAVVWNGTTRRRPTTTQKRHVESRNPTCLFPGCRMPATQCDLDHIHAWALGGPTSTRNLAPECRHDHRLRDKGWAVARIRPGVYQWKSPLGQVYNVRVRAP